MHQDTSTKQIAKDSGTTFHFNLDRPSRADLALVFDWLNSRDYPTTLSVVVRRALRAYFDRLRGFLADEDITSELVELERARKGVR